MSKKSLQLVIKKIYTFKELINQFNRFDLSYKKDELDLIYTRTIKDYSDSIYNYIHRIEELENLISDIEKSFDSYLNEIKKRNFHKNELMISEFRCDINTAKDKLNKFKVKYFNLANYSVYQEGKIDFESNMIEMIFSYRYLIASIAPLVSRLEWQSVGFEASNFPEVYQKSEFKYKGSLGYKRVHYPTLERYQDWFLREYFESDKRSELCCLMTNSGQGAFISAWEAISKFLLKDGDKILFSKYTYFETRWIMDQCKGFEIAHFDDLDTETIEKNIIKHKPKLVIIEPIYYADGEIRLLDLGTLLRNLNKQEYKEELNILVDASALGGVVNPFGCIDNQNINLFLFESMIKYRQCGLDQVNAGFIIANKKFRGKLIASRASCGAIFDYLNVGYLQKIRRVDYENRMKKITRNATYISKYLNAMEDKPKIFKGIEYPGSHPHPDNKICREQAFINGIFQVTLDNDYYSNFATKLSFIDHLINNAKEAGISVNHGTSFGFHNTRLSVADTGGGEFSDHYIRVSAGAECMKDIVILSRVFEKTIKEFFNN